MKDMDKLLWEAFDHMAAQEYENRPREVPRHRYSLRFHLKMRRTFREIAKRKNTPQTGDSVMDLYRPVRSKGALAVFSVLLLILIGGTAGGAEPIVRWLNENWLEQHGDFVEFQNDDLNSEILRESIQKYKLTEVPKGYELYTEEFTEEYGEYQVNYINQAGEVLCFIQNNLEKQNLGNITSNRDELEYIEVSDFEGYYLKDSNVGNLILSDGVTLVQLSGNLSKKELLYLAKGLQALE